MRHAFFATKTGLQNMQGQFFSLLRRREQAKKVSSAWLLHGSFLIK